MKTDDELADELCETAVAAGMQAVRYAAKVRLLRNEVRRLHNDTAKSGLCMCDLCEQDPTKWRKG